MLDNKRLDIFWNKVDKTAGLGPNGDCWEWIAGKKNKEGYGGFYIKEIDNTVLCHKISFCIFHNFELNDIPDAYVIRHLCNNPKCVNPSHLKLGTYKDNSKDMIDAGNSQFGIKNNKSIFSLEEVTEIRNLWLTGNYSQPVLAQKFKTTQGTIHKIVMGLSYKDNNYKPVRFKHSIKISKEDVDKIRELRENNRSVEEIVKLYNISRTQVYNILKKEQRKEE